MPAILHRKSGSRVSFRLRPRRASSAHFRRHRDAQAVTQHPCIASKPRHLPMPCNAATASLRYHIQPVLLAFASGAISYRAIGKTGNMYQAVRQSTPPTDPSNRSRRLLAVFFCVSFLAESTPARKLAGHSLVVAAPCHRHRRRLTPICDLTASTRGIRPVSALASAVAGFGDGRSVAREQPAD